MLAWLLGIVLVGIDGAEHLPQLWRLRGRLHAEDLSVWGVTLGVVLNIGWLVFSWRAWVPAGLAVDGLKAVQLTVMLAMLVRARRVHAVQLVVLAAGVGAAMATSVVALAALGVAVNVVSSVRALPQLVRSWHAEPDAVSVASWSLAGCSALGWLAYGVLIHVPLAGAFGLVLGPSSLALAARVAWRRRQRHHHPDTLA